MTDEQRYIFYFEKLENEKTKIKINSQILKRTKFTF